MLRVCQMVTSLAVGGAEKVMSELAIRADRSRFAVTVATARGGGPFEKVLQDAGIPVWTFDVSGLRAPAEFARLVTFLRGRFDVLHAHPGTVARYAALAAGVPALVSTLHNIYTWKPLAWRASDRLLMARTQRTIACTEEVRRSALPFYGLAEDAVTTVPNGVDLARYAPADAPARARARREVGLPEGHFWYVAAGHLIERKRYDLVLRALAKRRADGSRAALALCGEGEEQSRLEFLASELGLMHAGAVRFLGRRDDMARVLVAADAFVHAAPREGLPLAILEAMATGLPVVAARAGGVADAIEHEKSGLVVQPESEDALAQAMARVEADPAFAAALGRGARERALSRHSLDAMVKAYEAVWEDAFARANR